MPVVVQIMQSGDGRSWQKKRASPEGSFTAAVGSGTYVVMEPSALPSLQFVQVSLTAGPGFVSGLPTQPFAARVRIHATSRSVRRNAPASALRPMIPSVGVPESANLVAPEAATAAQLAAAPTPKTAASGTPSEATLQEILELVWDERGAGGDVASRIAGRLSNSARNELGAAARDARAQSSSGRKSG